MTLAEFKAWLEGFEASFSAPKVDGAECWDGGIPYIVPTVSQYAKIKEKLALVGAPVVSAPQMPRVIDVASDYYKQTAAQQYPQSITSRTTA